MNRLAQQTSPYLLQHTANPVDWWPWCDQALAAAHDQNKPILLSIGYSACHWCHVMAHESFEDPETAKVMNELFINIKVDREERPDLDHIYQTAHLLLSQRSGGWPLTMFLTPDGTPFFSGTYFPPSNRHGLPGFTDVLMSISDAYSQQRKQIEEQNQAVIEALRKTQPKPTDMELDGSLAQQASDTLLMHFEEQFGGFGRAPKFPHCPDLALLMRSAVCESNALARHACLHTLRCMAQGGLYDQLGGGFARYSVDGRWAIPHFEKMLYDNGALLGLYADAFALTGETLFSRTVSGTVQWVLREMQSPEGAFYSALDADSEGEEGKFYVWDRAEVASLLSKEQYPIIAMHYGLDQSPNFEGIHWHFHIAQPLKEVALVLGMTEAKAQQLLDEAQGILLTHRAQRIRPGCDDKILTSWNALMISGMARASAVLKEKTWLQSAQRAMDFIRQTLWHDGRLLATYKAGQAHLNAYLDDHAFLIDAALNLMQVEFRRQDLDFALKLADTLLSQFEDKDAGGFFFTRHDHEALVLRPKPAHDSAMTSGNGMAALVLQRLGHLVGRTDYLQAAERTLKLFHPSMQASTMGYGTLSMALAEYASPPNVLILRGEASQAWLQCLHTRCMPSTLCIYLPDDEKKLPASLDKPLSATATAWLCRGTECLPGIHTYTELLDKLDLTL